MWSSHKYGFQSEILVYRIILEFRKVVVPVAWGIYVSVSSPVNKNDFELKQNLPGERRRSLTLLSTNGIGRVTHGDAW